MSPLARSTRWTPVSWMRGLSSTPATAAAGSASCSGRGRGRGRAPIRGRQLEDVAYVPVRVVIGEDGPAIVPWSPVRTEQAGCPRDRVGGVPDVRQSIPVAVGRVAVDRRPRWPADRRNGHRRRSAAPRRAQELHRTGRTGDVHSARRVAAGGATCSVSPTSRFTSPSPSASCSGSTSAETQTPRRVARVRATQEDGRLVASR